MVASNVELTAFIKQQAYAVGFDMVGITSAAPFAETEERLHQHIANGYISGLGWFTAERASFACQPQNLMSSVRSIIALGISYRQPEPTLPTDSPPHGKVARYAWGQDYHTVLKDKMAALFELIQEHSGAMESRLLVDTARIVDRAVAQRAGLGFWSKNTNLINRQWGSYFFTAEILTDLELESDPPALGTCGRCTRCLDACPTEAIIAPGVVHNDRCISYLTIEQRGTVPLELREAIGGWVFGCDICQEVCPYNFKAGAGNHAEFAPSGGDEPAPNLIEWLHLTESEADFRARFKGTPLLRPKRAGLRRNVAIALGNSGDLQALAVVEAALDTENDPIVKEHLQWAADKLRSQNLELSVDNNG